MHQLKISSFPAVKSHTCCRKPESCCQQDINLTTQTAPLTFENYLGISGWILLDYIDYLGQAANENLGSKSNPAGLSIWGKSAGIHGLHGAVLICNSWLMFSPRKPWISDCVKKAGRCLLRCVVLRALPAPRACWRWDASFHLGFWSVQFKEKLITAKSCWTF